MISRLTATLILACLSPPLAANPFGLFELEDGHTNWQYLANTGGTVLILALSYTLFRLVLSNRRAQRYNRELEAVRSELEQRVRDRTATLDESNRLLQESNRVLQEEIAEHRATTERLRVSEAYIARILHSMPSMLIGLGPSGEITQWNRRAEEISGIPAEQAIGRNLWEAYPSITVSPDQVEAARRRNTAVSVKQSQRDRFYFDVTIYPLESGAETDAVVMIDDVTKRVLAENRLIQRDKMSAMGELAATMAEDLDAPLRGITHELRTLEDRLTETEPELATRVGRALALGAQAGAVTANLQAFAGTHPESRRPACITGLLDHSLELAESMLSQPSGLSFSDIRIERDYGEQLPQVPCYAAELLQVFLSLLRYCCHALGTRGPQNAPPTIRVQAHHYYDALWIKIGHNGGGISLDEQRHIFEPFFVGSGAAQEQQHENPRRLSFPHFIIAEQHRGELAVTSDIDRGTTFHIQLRLE